MGRLQENQPSQYQDQGQYPPETEHQTEHEVSSETLDDLYPPPREAAEAFPLPSHEKNKRNNYHHESAYSSETDPQSLRKTSKTQPVSFPPPQNSQPYDNRSDGPGPFPPQSPKIPPTFATAPQVNPQAFPPRQSSQPDNGKTSGPVPFPPQSPQVPTMFAAEGGYPTPPQAFPRQAEQAAFPPPHGGFAAQQAAQFSAQQHMMGTYNMMQQQQGGIAFTSPLRPNQQTMGIPMQQHNLATAGWKTHLLGCMDDPGNALITACFPCVTFGQIAEILDNGQTSCATSGLLYGLIACCIALPCLISCPYRAKLRSRYGLVESPAPDWLIHCFCECCALCQEYRELRQRGIDPSIGWHANVAKLQNLQQQQMGMIPPMHQAMRP